nr:YycC family protein [Neobacillus sp.]
MKVSEKLNVPIEQLMQCHSQILIQKLIEWEKKKPSFTVMKAFKIFTGPFKKPYVLTVIYQRPWR